LTENLRRSSFLGELRKSAPSAVGKPIASGSRLVIPLRRTTQRRRARATGRTRRFLPAPWRLAVKVSSAAATPSVVSVRAESTASQWPAGVAAEALGELQVRVTRDK
jgi:hypothetical protein